LIRKLGMLRGKKRDEIRAGERGGKRTDE